MIRIGVATSEDAKAFLASAVALVTTDAGRYDPDATDLDWAAQSGDSYVASALSGDNVVLLARDDEAIVGHLVGRLTNPNSLHPIRRAELESIHVYPNYRGGGIGSLLVEAFLTWATERGAERASVTAYAANEAALRFYSRHGFATRSVTFDRPLAQRGCTART
ncbi:MAG TPA: GNAT family N-acetyltransferase [Mycobacteriales bacterium]|nr:GNAT family N-acetyltransferase [Mycobacteriales bacterium]